MRKRCRNVIARANFFLPVAIPQTKSVELRFWGLLLSRRLGSRDDVLGICNRFNGGGAVLRFKLFTARVALPVSCPYRAEQTTH